MPACMGMMKTKIEFYELVKQCAMVGIGCSCIILCMLGSLVPSPTPSLLSLYRTASDEKLGDGLGKRLHVGMHG